jgi:hypothetical protein
MFGSKPIRLGRQPQAGEAAAALVRLPDDLLVVDAFKELPGHWHLRLFAP